ncbi:MAG TPA: PRC-barrel domain-containing protein [Solirubrobacteraceae bacterium]|nr:PRC-barrel domain-containing protein [Solirubrobacteraceae bacterium]
MIGVDHIEDWRGQKVIDQAGEELGKLEEVFFDVGSGTPLLISVKSGLLGRRSTLVPVDEARVGPDYVRVAHPKEVVDRAGTRRGEEAPGDEELAATGSAYGLRFSERVRLESATELARMRAEAEAARAQAEQLEADAQEKIAAHEAARQRAESAGEDVSQAEREAEAARQAALEARQNAERYRETP